MARSLDEVKKALGPKDYAAAMRAALAGIPAGKYETSAELCQRVRFDRRQIPAMAAQFSGHAVTLGTRGGAPAWMWARTPADAKKLRDALKSQNG